MPQPSLRVAVFGSSEPLPGEPLYETARRLGRLLAEAGHAVVTGGYGGVMEGASRGATEAGGRAIGVTCEIFRDRRPNPYLTETRRAADLYERTRLLIEPCAAFVVLEGKAGTLAELAFLWALQRAGCLAGKPVLLLQGRWREFVEAAERWQLLDAGPLAVTRVVERIEEVPALVQGGSPPDGS